MTDLDRVPSRRHYIELDALRGIAAIAVALYHAGIMAGLPGVASFGYLAVDLFFMMSGFVVARSYERRLATDLFVGRFVVIRVARLYPCLMLGVGLACVAEIIIGKPLEPASIFKHLMLIPTLGLGNLFPLNSVLWSLFFEIFINIIHAAAFPWLTTKRVFIATAGAGICFLTLIIHFKGPGLGWGGSTFWAGFARVGWGYGIGILISRLAPLPRIQLPSMTAWITVVIAATLLYAPNFGFSPLRVIGSLFFVFPVTVIACASYGDQAILGRLGRFLGGISYPLYVIHLPILIIITNISNINQSFISFTISIIALIIFSQIIDYFFDDPLRVRIKRILS